MSEARRKAVKPARAKKHWALRVLGWLTALFFVGVIGAVATFFIVYQTTKIPDPNKEFATNTTTVTYADQKNPLGSFYEQNRHTVPLAADPEARAGRGDRGRGPHLLDQPGHLAVRHGPRRVEHRPG